MLKNLKNLSKSSLPENSKFKWIVISVLIFFLLIIILYLSTIQKKPFAVSANSSKSAPLILQKKLHDNLEAILTALKQTNALEFTMQKAQQEADKAIACLDFLAESQYKQALISLARIAVERDH